jgi:RND family efflux transporter MFP subunit
VQDEYERKSKLVESQAVSEAVVVRLRLRVDAQQAAVHAIIARKAILEAQLDRARAEQRAAAEHRDLLIEEREELALAEAAVAGAEAAIQLADAVHGEAALRLDRMAVRSPVTGIVLRRLVSPGSKVRRDGSELSAHIVHMYDPEHLQVRVDVPLADAGHVSVGQSAQIMVAVLPEQTFLGQVTRIVHEADIQKNTVEVKVAIENPNEQLKPEMLARVKFLAVETTRQDTSSRQRVFAPKSLLKSDDTGATSTLVVVSLIEQRGRVERRTVTTGRREMNGWIEIESGLNVGDLLIADPTAALEPGDRVRIVGEQSMAEGT